MLAAFFIRHLPTHFMYFLDRNLRIGPPLALWVTISPSVRPGAIRSTLYKAGLPRDVSVRFYRNWAATDMRRMRRRFNTSWRRCIGCAPPPIFERGHSESQWLPLGGSTFEQFITLSDVRKIALPLPSPEDLQAYVMSTNPRIRGWAFENMSTMRLRSSGSAAGS